MPFHDFRVQLPAKAQPDFEKLGALAKRYGVSLTAAILRWLEYTETRAMLVVSNEGFAHWAKPSKAALRSGRYIRTKNEVFELPTLATAVTRDFRCGRRLPPRAVRRGEYLLSSPAASGRRTGLLGFLNRRARNICEGAEDATIAGERSKLHAAMVTVVKKPAGIGRHRFD